MIRTIRKPFIFLFLILFLNLAFVSASDSSWVVYETVIGAPSVARGSPSNLTDGDLTTWYYAVLDRQGIDLVSTRITVRLQPAAGLGNPRPVSEIRGIVYVGDTALSTVVHVIDLEVGHRPQPDRAPQVLRAWHYDRFTDPGFVIPSGTVFSWSSSTPVMMDDVYFRFEVNHAFRSMYGQPVGFLEIEIIEGPPQVSIEVVDQAAEPDDPGAFRVSRTGDLSTPLTVRYVVQSGSAVPGVDYETLPGAVTIEAGEASAEIPIRPIDDQIVEGDETVWVALLQDPSYVIGNPPAAILIIADDEGNPVEVELSAQAMTTNNDGWYAENPLEVTVKLRCPGLVTTDTCLGPLRMIINQGGGAPPRFQVYDADVLHDDPHVVGPCTVLKDEAGPYSLRGYAAECLVSMKAFEKATYASQAAAESPPLLPPQPASTSTKTITMMPISRFIAPAPFG